MRPKDIFKMCIQNLKRRFARTFLTVLGVLIGCCSIVIMVSIGIGMKEQQERMLSEMGDLTVITVSAPQGGKGKTKLDDTAVKEFKTMEGVETATPKLSLDDYSVKLYAGLNNRYECSWSTIVGMDSEALPKLGYNVQSGNLINGKSGDIIAGQFLAYNFIDTLRPASSNQIDRWGNYDEDGKEKPLPDPFFDILKTPVTMVIEGEDKKATVKFNTVGKVKEDYSKGYETSEGIIMDIDDVRKIIEQMGDKKIKKINYGSVIVKVSHITKVGEVEKKIKSMGYNTSSMESIRKPMEKEAHQKQLMLGGLGAISLFVAALGITNTMIMSISERTKEIGIMKSLGCFIKDIRILFLSEAAAIGFIGGIVGSLISFVVSIVMNLVSSGGVSLQNIIGAIIGGPQVSRMSVIPLWLYLFAILFSVLIGICSGYYPANRAVKIPALEAIKGE